MTFCSDVRGMFLQVKSCSPWFAQLCIDFGRHNKKHYVDDYLDCKDNEDGVLETIIEVRRVQKLGRIELIYISKIVMKTLTKDKDSLNI